ncbi:MAG: hypothetical protein ACTSRW_11715 [Candidatus Helarchaeota archaeon]
MSRQKSIQNLDTKFGWLKKLKKTQGLGTFVTIRLKRVEKARWMEHAKNKYGETLSQFIRRLVEMDISETIPAINPTKFEDELEKVRFEIQRLNLAITTLATRDDSYESRFEFEMLYQLVINKIDSFIRSNKIRGQVQKLKDEITVLFGPTYRI